jgi:glycosyltransferase involved in cell wall biosynthesis
MVIYQKQWICCQIGAREHYAIPRALHLAHQLKACFTDTWVPPHSLFRWLSQLRQSGLGDRFHPDLQQAPIQDFTYSALVFEVVQRLQSTSPWATMMARNRWFQTQVVQRLERLKVDQKEAPILFSYSYAALDIFRYARSRGWQTVLGQIDPGPAEDQIVQTVARRYPHLALPAASPPPEYWQHWHQECELADQIVVNSSWSAQLLEQSGIPKDKLAIIPLVYKPDPQAINFKRHYPSKFTGDRPLRVLFLGQVNLRKGIGEILEAIELLEREPIEWWIVGPVQIKIPERFKSHPQVRWIGTVPRSQVSEYYQQADVFLLPTHSDGFALTQLEAQAWKLPLVASSNCGKVMQPHLTGLELRSLCSSALVEAISFCIKYPDQLKFWSSAVKPIDETDSLCYLGEKLAAII